MEIEYKKEDENIIVSINGNEKNRIPLKDAIMMDMNIKSIVLKEIRDSPEIRAVEKFFVKVNGRKVKTRDVKSISIQDVRYL